jgi:AcrR family transcriptional regulator
VVATDKGAETRRRIVAAAAGAFAEHGYAGTSVSDVIGAAGVTKGGFYFHFESKAELALEVVRTKREEWRQAALALAGEKERGVDQLTAVVRALAAFEKRDSAVVAVNRLCLELADDPQLAGAIDHFGAWIETTTALLARISDEGDLPADVDLDAAARFAVGSWMGFCQLVELQGDDLSTAAEEYLRFALPALGLPAPAPIS